MTSNAILLHLSATRSGQWGAFGDQAMPHKVFSALWALEAEVNNGGFVQYFYNTANETAPFVVEALQAIGATHTADICSRAIVAAFPAGLPGDPTQISAAAQHFSPEVDARLDALDREFFQYPDDLTTLLYRYVRSHPEDFGPVPIAEDESFEGCAP